MKYILKISKENVALSLAEIKNVCKPKKYKLISSYVLLNVKNKLKNYFKLAYTKKVYEVIASEEDLDKITKKLEAITFDKDLSFRLQILHSKNRQKQIKAIAHIIGKEKKVDLTSFDEEYGILQTSKQLCVAKNIWENTDDYQSRNPMNRPIMHPTSLKPRFAKAMINLANPKKELYDPFCGSGGILLESCMLGLKTYGSDLDRKMILYSLRNLKHYGVKANLKVKNGLNPSRQHEAIVTDIPYGKNSKLDGSVQDFIDSFLTNYSKYTDNIVVCHPDFVHIHSKDFKVMQQINEYINKSLTRTVTVLKK